MKKRKKKISSKLQDNPVLKATHSAVKDFYHKILMLQEEERRRISRDLHDETGQMVIALGASLNILEKHIRDGRHDNALSVISENRKLIQEIATKMKSMALNLRPPALDILGLSAVLREYFSQCTKSNAVRIEFKENMKDVKLNENLEITIYRIVQEATFNVIRHSKATALKIMLILSDNQIELTIEDNGKGFNFDEYKKTAGAAKMGLRGIRERVEILKGKINLETGHNKGTKITIELPLEKSDYGNTSNAG